MVLRTKFRIALLYLFLGTNTYSGSILELWFRVWNIVFVGIRALFSESFGCWLRKEEARKIGG